MELEPIIITIITHSGDAKSSSLEAIKKAKKGDFKDANILIDNAEEKLLLAHKEQTKLIQMESQGNKIEATLLMIHAQDHLMNAITIKDLAKEIIDIHKKITE